jgi:hypothetical protein
MHVFLEGGRVFKGGNNRLWRFGPCGYEEHYSPHCLRGRMLGSLNKDTSVALCSKEMCNCLFLFYLIRSIKIITIDLMWFILLCLYI